MLSPLVLLCAMSSNTRFKPVATPVPLSHVRLLASPYKAAMDADHAYLLTVDPLRLLHRFYVNASLPTRGEMYGGWERDTISGHSLGHYLSACSQMFAATGDPALATKIDTILGELERCQAARKDGLVSGVPDIVRVFEEVRKGDIRSKGFDLNGLWVPWYTQHKLIAGLLDAHEHLGRANALAMARRQGDWAVEITRDLTPEQWQTMLACEHGGIAESLAELTARTGEKAYVALALKFHHDAVMNPLEAGEPKIAGLHGNTQIPKVIAAARQFELTGDERFRKAAEFFWEQVVEQHSYAIGGHGFGEYFGPPSKLNNRLGPNTCETCNSYNMLKLSRHVFAWSPSVEEGDFYERAQLNHILASQNHTTGMTCYFVPLQPGARKTFSDAENTFTCCHGTGMENHAKYGDGIYYTAPGTLWINGFVPSVLDWKERGLKVSLETQMPLGPRVSLRVDGGKAARFKMVVRCPAWASGPVVARVTGVVVGTGQPGSLLEIEREWKPGDTLVFDLPMSLRTEPMPDNPRRVAVFYGPTVLAGLWRGASPDEKVPVFLAGDKPVAEWFEREPGEALAFRSKGTIRPDDLRLVPFHEVQGERYSVYWDLFDDADWQKREAEYRDAERVRAEMEARTVDFLALGEMQPERDHGLEGEKTGVGDFGGRKWRHAWDEGWFSFAMKVDGSLGNALVLTYWGSDGGNREFDILVDGLVVATQKLEQMAPNRFVDVTYALPRTATDGKQLIAVRIQARKRTTAGGVFGVRVVRT